MVIIIILIVLIVCDRKVLRNRSDSRREGYKSSTVHRPLVRTARPSPRSFSAAATVGVGRWEIVRGRVAMPRRSDPSESQTNAGWLGPEGQKFSSYWRAHHNPFVSRNVSASPRRLFLFLPRRYRQSVHRDDRYTVFRETDPKPNPTFVRAAIRHLHRGWWLFVDRTRPKTDRCWPYNRLSNPNCCDPWLVAPPGRSSGTARPTGVGVTLCAVPVHEHPVMC